MLGLDTTVYVYSYLYCIPYLYPFFFIGIANCSINVHLSLHLPYYVRNLGPLWSHSAFGFENCMQDFLRHSHATRNIGKQVDMQYRPCICVLHLCDLYHKVVQKPPNAFSIQVGNFYKFFVFMLQLDYKKKVIFKNAN